MLTCGRFVVQDGVCMNGYKISIEEILKNVTDIFPNTPCQKVPLLSYDGKVPGPLIIGQTGVQDVTRFTNNIPPDSIWFPPAGPGSRGGEGEPALSDRSQHRDMANQPATTHSILVLSQAASFVMSFQMSGCTGETDLCAERAARYQEREFNGTKIHGGTSKVTNGTGRATVTHHHGMASTSSMDGWAEQFVCYGESKVSAPCDAENAQLLSGPPPQISHPSCYTLHTRQTLLCRTTCCPTTEPRVCTTMTTPSGSPLPTHMPA
jgi:hypothetical protein